MTTKQELQKVRDALEYCIANTGNDSISDTETIIWSQGSTSKPHLTLHHIKLIRATLDSIIAGADGYVMVPIEPTIDMVMVGSDLIKGRSRGVYVRNMMTSVYKAMIAAAPKHGGNDD